MWLIMWPIVTHVDEGIDETYGVAVVFNEEDEVVSGVYYMITWPTYMYINMGMRIFHVQWE